MTTTMVVNTAITSGLKGNATSEELGGVPALHRLPWQHTAHVLAVALRTICVAHTGVVGQPTVSTHSFHQILCFMPENLQIQT